MKRSSLNSRTAFLVFLWSISTAISSSATSTSTSIHQKWHEIVASEDPIEQLKKYIILHPELLNDDTRLYGIGVAIKSGKDELVSYIIYSLAAKDPLLHNIVLFIILSLTALTLLKAIKLPPFKNVSRRDLIFVSCLGLVAICLTSYARLQYKVRKKLLEPCIDQNKFEFLRHFQEKQEIIINSPYNGETLLEYARKKNNQKAIHFFETILSDTQ